MKVEYSEVEESVYEADLLDIESKPSEKYGGNFHIWKFKTAVGEFSGTTSSSWHPGSKGGRWGRAVVGREIKKDEDTDTWRGRPCLIDVRMNDAGYPKVFEVYPKAPAKSSAPAATGPAVSAPAATPPVAGAPEPSDVVDDDIPF